MSWTVKLSVQNSLDLTNNFFFFFLFLSELAEIFLWGIVRFQIPVVISDVNYFQWYLFIHFHIIFGYDFLVVFSKPLSPSSCMLHWSSTLHIDIWIYLLKFLVVINFIPGYAVAEGRPVRERRLPCCGIGCGWFL